jgi:hypothetical protein
MSALSIQVPYQIFADSDGTPLDNGYVWIGTTNLDPRTNPVNVYFDAALTQVAPNPLRTVNGYVYNAGSPAQLYIDGVNFSLRVEDKKSVLVYSFPAGSGISPNASGVVYTPAGTGAVATTVQGKLRESVSVLDFGANTTPGTTDMTAAIYAACTAAGTSGTVFFPKGNYRIQSDTYASFTCGVMRFDGGAILVPDAGSVFTIFADIEAGSHQIFNVGKTVLACDCQEGTTQVTSWTYGFQASDVGKFITVPFGGAKIGAAPGATYVQNRNSFTTTIASYATDNSITLSAALISSIRQNYVYNAGFANQNTGYVIVGNGTITLTPTVGKVNVKWFGATGDGSTDDSFNINKALLSATRQYGGLSFYFPPGTYALGNEILLDVQGTTLTCDHHLTTLFRKNGIAAERMNVIKAVWRGRYGGGNPSATSESWAWSATEYVWVADWAIMYDILIENFIINGNQANQPVIPTGTGHDGWDSGISTLYVGRGTYRNLMVVNTQRWGIALSTLSSNSLITGCFADTCNEGAYYAETSSDIRIIGNYSFNSPAAGWSMGAITFLTIAQGEIADNVINGGNNGVYVRGATVGVSVTGNSIKIPDTYGIWTFDETSTGGANAPRFLSITGNTIDTPGSYAIRNSWSSDLVVSNNTINTTGTGVYFNNTPRVTYADNLITGAATNYNNAGGNSIVFLDDSGTFTPTIQGLTTAGTATYGPQYGRWQRRGRIVTFDLVVSWTTATGTGNLQVQLPFTTASEDNSIFNALAYNFAYTGNAVAVGSGGSNFATMWNINDGTPSQIPVAASGTIWLSGSFEM